MGPGGGIRLREEFGARGTRSRAREGRESGRGQRGSDCVSRAFLANRLESEGVLAGGDHGQRDRIAVFAFVNVPGFKPDAEARIDDFRFVLPEAGLETALNVEVIELQFDHRGVRGKVAADIVRTNVQTCAAAAFA